jgi:hypothetical protein
MENHRSRGERSRLDLRGERSRLDLRGERSRLDLRGERSRTPQLSTVNRLFSA